MRTPILPGASAACITLCLAVCAVAQPAGDASSSADTSRYSEPSGAPPGGVPLTQLIAAVSKSTGKKFLLDPRTRAEIIPAGTAPASVSYNDLITILLLHGFVVVEGNGAIRSVISWRTCAATASSLWTRTRT